MNAIEKYFRYRQSLIDQYLKGDMTKSEYLEMNYYAVINNGIKPFKIVDNIQKALYNYQYYNALAKQMKSYSKEYKLDFELKKNYLEKMDYYYYKKDRATSMALKILDYKGVEAYFVSVRSKSLNGKLFEIVLVDTEMILHSTSESILNRLKDEGVFCYNKKPSLIDGYVNQRY